MRLWARELVWFVHSKLVCVHVCFVCVPACGHVCSVGNSMYSVAFHVKEHSFLTVGKEE